MVRMAARVRIPRTELDVHPLCLGGNVFGWTADAPTSFAVLDAYRAAGGDFVDTADSYTWRVEGNTGGDSERVLGDWMAERGVRDEWSSPPRSARGRSARGSRRRTCAPPATTRCAACAPTTSISTTPTATTRTRRSRTRSAAFDELVRAGKIRYVGLSNYSAERLSTVLTLSERHGLARPVALQPHYNLVERAGYEDELAELVSSADLGVMPYFALAKGFLTGKYRPGDAAPDTSGPMASARAGGAMAYLDARGERVLGVLDDVAAAHAVPLAAVALAWLAAQPTVTAPIASARTVDQLGTILPMAELTLAPDELAALT